jgi:hypothetical protein
MSNISHLLKNKNESKLGEYKTNILGIIFL